jgi:hypothetical protein
MPISTALIPVLDEIIGPIDDDDVYLIKLQHGSGL